MPISFNYTGIKICYKIDKFAYEENMSKVSAELMWLNEIPMKLYAIFGYILLDGFAPTSQAGGEIYNEKFLVY